MDEWRRGAATTAGAYKLKNRTLFKQAAGMQFHVGSTIQLVFGVSSCSRRASNKVQDWLDTEMPAADWIRGPIPAGPPQCLTIRKKYQQLLTTTLNRKTSTEYTFFFRF